MTIVVKDGNGAPRTISTLDDLMTLVGAIDPAPTANTMMDRLKAIATALGLATPAGANIIGKVDHTTTSIGHGKKAVTTAGTDLPLAASTPAKWVTVQAYRANTGFMTVGGAGVDGTAANGDGISLAAGESVTLPIDNLADVSVDATVSGEGVRFTYGS